MVLKKVTSFNLIIILVLQFGTLHSTKLPNKACYKVFHELVGTIWEAERQAPFLKDISFKELETFALSKLKEIEKVHGLKLKEQDWLQIRAKLLKLTKGNSGEEAPLDPLMLGLTNMNIKMYQKVLKLDKKIDQICLFYFFPVFLAAVASQIVRDTRLGYEGKKSEVREIFFTLLGEVRPSLTLSKKELKIIEEGKELHGLGSFTNAQVAKIVEEGLYLTGLAALLYFISKGCLKQVMKKDTLLESTVP